MFKYQESHLDNGLKIYIAENPSFPILNLYLVSQSGSRYEDQDESGYAHLLEHMLMKGTTSYPTPVALSREVEKMGGIKNASTGYENMVFSIEVDDSNIDKSFEILADIIRNPLIDEKVLENEKNVVLEEIKWRYGKIENVVFQATQESLFSGHPLSRSIGGSPESIKKATRHSLLGYKNRLLIPNNSALIAIGGIGKDESVSLANKYFGQWEKGDSIKADSFETHSGHKSFFYKKDLNQFGLTFNFYTAGGSDRKAAVFFKLISYLLGGSSSSLLNQELRHKQGLAYSIESNHLVFKEVGVFTVGVISSNPTESLNVIKETLNMLPNYLTKSVLEEAKHALIAKTKRKLINPSFHKDVLISIFYLGRPLISVDDLILEIANIERDELVDFIKNYLSPDKGTAVLVGPEDVLT